MRRNEASPHEQFQPSVRAVAFGQDSPESKAEDSQLDVVMKSATTLDVVLSVGSNILLSSCARQ